jgi:hypothetical protein
MAYAGNPSDLAKQPASSSSSGNAGSWQPLLTAIVVVAIVVVVAMATAFIAGSNRAKGLPAADTSYAQIEAQRGVAAPWLVTEDHRYDSIESLRGNLRGGTPQSVAPGSFAPADRSLEQIKDLSASISRMVYQTAAPHVTLRRTAPKTVAPVDHRYDDIESLRGNMR